MIAVRTFAGKGRGVIALRSFAPGETIELAPVLVIPGEQAPRLARTVLAGHCFQWGPGAGDVALVLGVCQLCNHSYTPNAEYRHDYARQTMRFEALREIRAGDEITVNYNGDPADPSPMWFDVLP